MKLILTFLFSTSIIAWDPSVAVLSCSVRVLKGIVFFLKKFLIYSLSPQFLSSLRAARTRLINSIKVQAENTKITFYSTLLFSRHPFILLIFLAVLLPDLAIPSYQTWLPVVRQSCYKQIRHKIEAEPKKFHQWKCSYATFVQGFCSYVLFVV